MGKPVFRVSDWVRHKSGRTKTSKRLEILDLAARVRKAKVLISLQICIAADQLILNAKCRFLMTWHILSTTFLTQKNNSRHLSLMLEHPTLCNI